MKCTIPLVICSLTHLLINCIIAVVFLSKVCVCNADGHHKLIAGELSHMEVRVDGYSRMIVYLECSDNNKSATVHRLFLVAVRFGLPSRVRSNFGGENVTVASHMLQHRGTG